MLALITVLLYFLRVRKNKKGMQSDVGDVDVEIYVINVDGRL